MCLGGAIPYRRQGGSKSSTGERFRADLWSGLASVGVFASNARLDLFGVRHASMAIRIKARGGESVEQMLRRFKKMCEKEGLTKEIKRRQYFEKPSERRRRAVRKSIQRALRNQEKPARPRS